MISDQSLETTFILFYFEDIYFILVLFFWSRPPSTHLRPTVDQRTLVWKPLQQSDVYNMTRML